MLENTEDICKDTLKQICQRQGTYVRVMFVSVVSYFVGVCLSSHIYLEKCNKRKKTLDMELSVVPLDQVNLMCLESSLKP